MSRLKWSMAFLPCLLFVASALSYAVDGVVLIDQNHALAGNVTPGDAPGFPITISQPGSYKLAGNLTIGDKDTGAIEITANDVTIDLGGFSITGPITCAYTQFGPAQCPLAGQGI